MPRRRPRSVHLLRLAPAAALGGAAAGVLLPDRLRLDHRFPFVDAVAWRPSAAVGAVAAAGVLATGWWTRPTAAVVGAVGLAGLAAVAGRAVGHRPAPPQPGDLTLLTVNVLKGRADTGELAALIDREGPHLVVLPEAGVDFRDELLPLVHQLGYRAWVTTGPGTSDRGGVTLLVAERAGDVRVRRVSQLRLPHLEATGGVLGHRTLHAVHLSAPMPRRLLPRWRGDLEVVGRWCRGPVAPIVAGDFNATLDHAPMRAALGGCRSAAVGPGRGLVGTFPSSLPRWFGIQIDHVLVPAGTATSRFEVVDVTGSDHRGVLVRMRLPEH